MPEGKGGLPMMGNSPDIKCPHPSSIWTNGFSSDEICFLETAFLVLLVSGSSTSDVHALEFNSLRFQENYGYVLVEPVPEFKAKTTNKDAKSQRVEVIKIPTLTPTLSPDWERTNLFAQSEQSMGIGLIQSLRKQNSSRRLFISFKKGFSGVIHRNILVGWMKALLLFFS